MSDAFFESIRDALPYRPFICENINLSYLPHFHSEIEIVYVHKGKTEVAKNGLVYSLSEGDILFVYPLEIHAFLTGENSTIHVIKLFVLRDFPHTGDINMLSQENPLHKTFKELLDKIIDNHGRSERESPYAVAAFSNELLCTLLRLSQNDSINADREQKNGRRIFSQTQEYLEKHYTEPITLTEIAAYCGYSKYHYSHLFVKTASMSFVRYLTFFRLQKAKQLLVTDKSITEIALYCGFGTLRSFNRCFRDCFHMTPGEFKKTYQSRQTEPSS